jgi:hypothetical protein
MISIYTYISLIRKQIILGKKMTNLFIHLKIDIVSTYFWGKGYCSASGNAINIKHIRVMAVSSEY